MTMSYNNSGGESENAGERGRENWRESAIPGEESTRKSN